MVSLRFLVVSVVPYIHGCNWADEIGAPAITVDNLKTMLRYGGPDPSKKNQSALYNRLVDEATRRKAAQIAQ